MVGLAAAFGAGLALALRGAPVPPAPLLLLLLLAPIGRFLRPAPSSTLDGYPAPSGTDGAGGGVRRGRSLRILLGVLVALSAGLALGRGWREARAADCRHRIPDGAVRAARGRFLGRPGAGAVPFLVEGGLGGGCRGVIRVHLARGEGTVGATGLGSGGGSTGPLSPGAAVVAHGRWRRLPFADPRRPERAGYLAVDRVRAVDGRGGPGGWHLRIRGRVQERLLALFPRRGPVAEALLLARKEGLDPTVRDAFARSGTAHLLAISGFHVGVVAGLLLGLGRLAGLGPRRVSVLAAVGAWAYVLWIGAPDAAARAALLLSGLAAGRVRGTPVFPPGGLASAFLLLLLVDPGALLRPGFQLSFAGVAGLILGARPLEAVLAGPDPGALRRRIASPLAAAIAATLATLPLVAWHFGRVPLVGIPATLLTTPLVALAIPGIVAVLLLSAVAPGPAHFLAGGVELLLDAAVAATGLAAGIPGAAPWVPRSWVPAGVLGVVAGAVVAARLDGVAGWRRRVLLLAGGISALIAVPGAEAVARRGALQMAFLSVGQGDAVALRSPAGRWLLVDAGPRSGSFDAGARRVVPWLRRRGVGRLEALVLTHPDLDHLGGAPAVLSSLEVGGVLDPGVADPRLPFGEALDAAGRRGVGWWRAEPGRTLFLDGVELRVLHAGPPPPDAAAEFRGSESNAHSVVLLVRYGAFRALLTGDAPAEVEGWILPRLGGPVHLLKVGHHGSRTSTSLELLETAHPDLAVISVGWRNRFGHPHSVVLDRLRGVGARVLRTDLHGTVIVRAALDGSWSVESDRNPGRRAGAMPARPRGAEPRGARAPARR